MKYNIVTYGCQMNIHESEKLAGILESRGYTASTTSVDSDVVVFNTCCIRETAQTRALGNIGALKHLKKQRPDMIIAVCGCMPQQKGVGDMVFEKYPHVDIVFGTHNLHSFADILDKRATQKRVKEIWGGEEIKPKNTPVSRSGRCNAWVNIIYGCNNFCTYCIVPYVRGREKSRPIDEIVTEVTDLVVNQKYPEITLLGQNVNSYGNDMGIEGVNFAELLRRLCKIEGDFRLKFMTSHPKDLSDEVIEVIASQPKMSKLIHLPIQSGSNTTLSRMNRRYTREQYLSTISNLRSAIPGVGLSSDMMVGFPGESEQDYLDTLDLVKEVRYNNLYMFVYSRRTGTPADKMPDQIDTKTKKARISELIALQRTVSAEIARESLGNVYKVLYEDIQQDGTLLATSDCGKLIYVKGCNEQQDLVGRFGVVKVTGNKSGRMMGEITD